MRAVELKILASLAEEDEPLPWINLVNSICPAPAAEIPDAFAELLKTRLIEVSGSGTSERFAITDAGRESLAATADEEPNR